MEMFTLAVKNNKENWKARLISIVKFTLCDHLSFSRTANGPIRKLKIPTKKSGKRENINNKKIENVYLRSTSPFSASRISNRIENIKNIEKNRKMYRKNPAKRNSGGGGEIDSFS